MPVITKIANEYAGRITFAKIDGDRLFWHPKYLVEAFDFHASPLLLVVRDGEIVARLQGIEDGGEEQLRAELDAALGATGPAAAAE